LKIRNHKLFQNLYIFWFSNLYLGSFFSLWFLIFNKAIFQQGKNTRILRLRQKLTNAWSLQDIMIVYIQKVFRFVHFWGSFPIKTNENVFWKNQHLHMHSSTQRSLSGPFFEQLVTLVMFFSWFFDVENHVSIMRKSLISIFFRAGPICQPVTGAASIEKNFFD